MESIYSSSNILINEIQEVLFPRLENTVSVNDQANAVIIESEIETKLKQLDTNCDKLEIFVNKSGPNERPQLKLRLDQFRYDSRHLLSSLRNLHHKRVQREREEREREELLTRRFTTNSETNIAIGDYYVDERSKLNSFHAGIDDMLASGANVLSSLRDQRGILKGAQKKTRRYRQFLRSVQHCYETHREKRTYRQIYTLWRNVYILCLNVSHCYVFNINFQFLGFN